MRAKALFIVGCSFAGLVLSSLLVMWAFQYRGAF